MDLSKSAKRKRDAVEVPLFLTEQLLDELEEITTRVNATTQVWHETQRTLDPALTKLHKVSAQVSELQKALQAAWHAGAAQHWK